MSEWKKHARSRCSVCGRLTVRSAVQNMQRNGCTQHQVELKTFLRRLCSRLRAHGIRSGPALPTDDRPTSWCQPGRSAPQACLLGKLVTRQKKS